MIKKLSLIFLILVAVSIAGCKMQEIEQNIPEGAVLLGEVEIDSFNILFYENDDKYLTLIKEQVSSYENSIEVLKFEDNVKLVGWCSMRLSDYGKEVTAIPVQSFDEKVAYITMGKDIHRNSKNISYGEVVVFAWDKLMSWNDLEAIAYSSDDIPLYELGYEIRRGEPIKTNELRWLPLD